MKCLRHYLAVVVSLGLGSFIIASSWGEAPDRREHLPDVSRSDLTTVYSPQEVNNRDLTFRDTRLLTMRHTDTKYTLEPYDNRDEWEERAEQLRERAQISAGLWPMPEKTPLNAEVFGRIERDGYTVEKVYIETYPDYFLAGNLYRPTEEGPHPAILSPHGHWSRGRINDTERGSIPARAINFARQGYVVFAYDMVGYGDTRQVNHSFASDSLSQLWGMNLLGLQLWNSVRSLDFVRSLSDVDDERVGITGASGGATQTFMLTAIDDEERLKVTAPVNMISTIMQGGSLCENAPGLRLDAFNIHIGALAAPRPQLMVSNTQDWTVHTPTTEYPMMESFYQLYGAEERLANAHFDYPHNYNKASREAVYPWFARWLKGAENPGSYREEPYEAEGDEDLLVFLKEAITDRSLTYQDFPEEKYRSLPEGYYEMDESALKAYLREKAQQQIADYWPTGVDELEAFDEIYGTGYRHVMAAELPADVRVEDRGSAAGSDFTVHRLLIARDGEKDWIPAILYQPEQKSQTATVVAHPRGKEALVAEDRSEPGSLVRQLLDEGHQVLAIDPFKVGEHTVYEGTATERDESFNHFLTFNRADAQEQVQDILTAVAALRGRNDVQHVNLVGVQEAGAWSLLAGGLADRAIDHLLVLELPEIAGSSSGAMSWFVPGLLKMGGLKTAAALRAPEKLTIHSLSGTLDGSAIADVYGLRDGRDAFQVVNSDPQMSGSVGQLLE